MQRTIGRGLVRAFLAAALGTALPGFASEKTYTVKKADTLSRIAFRHGVKTRELAKHNDLKDADRLRVGQRLRIPPKAGDPVRYTVKAGDTIDRIARAHHVEVKAVAKLNKLSDPDRIHVGDVLRIPAASKVYTLPGSMQPSLDKVRIKRGRWKYIVLHHSASDQGSMKGMDEYHRRKRRMENGLAYHFVIGNGRGMGDGVIGIGHRWKGQLNGGHLASEWQNTRSIGICLVGNFEKRGPTRKQRESVKALLYYLMKRCGLSESAVKTHRQINTKPTICPGKHFPSVSTLCP